MIYLHLSAIFILDVLLTWLLGFAIPLTLVAIMRRPFTRFWAFVLTGLLWLLEVVVFMLIGSKSRTHAALFAVAIVTYYVLRRGIGPIAIVKMVGNAVHDLLRPPFLACFFWVRYLQSRRIVFLSVAAVALSVSLLIVVASLFTGFIDAFERSAVETIGAVVLTAPEGVTFGKYPLFIERLEESGVVEGATATLRARRPLA